MIEIDGSLGEGGGQILRTSLALSLVTGQPFHAFKIRRGRKKPGLLAQHLTGVEAAAKIGGAEVTGAKLGSQEIVFRPGSVRSGDYAFRVPTAGSAGLVLQTVLMPLALAGGPSHLVLEGGTHNPSSPPFDFLERAFLPLLAGIGIRAEAKLERPGFYPQGGGRFEVDLVAEVSKRPLELVERGAIRALRVKAIVSKLPRTIAERELAVVERTLALDASVERSARVEEVANAHGPGNAIVAELVLERSTEVFTAFGEKGKPAERVAEELVGEVMRFVEVGAPVGEHLQDQLLLPLALCAGGQYRTTPLSSHAKTNIDVIGRFLDVEITTEPDPEGGVRVLVSSAKR